MVVNVWSEPLKVPKSLVTTAWKWTVVPAGRPVRAAEKADTPPATAQIASSGAGVPVALLHDQPYPPRTVTRRDPPGHRRPATKATLRVAKAARPAPAAPAVPSEPQLQVHVPAGGIVASRGPDRYPARRGWQHL